MAPGPSAVIEYCRMGRSHRRVFVDDQALAWSFAAGSFGIVPCGLAVIACTQGFTTGLLAMRWSRWKLREEFVFHSVELRSLDSILILSVPRRECRADR